MLVQQGVILADDNTQFSPITVLTSLGPWGKGEIAGAARGRALVILPNDGAERLLLPQPTVALLPVALVLLVELLWCGSSGGHGGILHMLWLWCDGRVLR